MKNSNTPVIVKQNFNVPIAIIWEAITQPAQMRQWFFNNIPDFKATVGFKTSFMVKTPERDFLHEWEITNVIPFKKISYYWKYKGYKGLSLVNFELFEKGSSNTLELSHETLENFDKNIPEFTTESCTQGWQYFIQQRLKDYLAKK